MSTALLTSIRVGLVLLLWMPVIYTSETVFSGIVGKALYARVLIEVVTALYLILLLWHPEYRPRPSLVVMAFAGYVAVVLLSLATSVNVTHSLWSDYSRMLGVWDLLHWLLFVVVATSVLRSSGAWYSLLNWNLAVALIVSLVGFAQIHQISLFSFLPNFGVCRVPSTLGNPSFLAAMLVVTTLLAVGFLVRSFLQSEGGDPESLRSTSSSRRQGGQQTERSRRLMNRGHYWWRVFWAITAGLGLWVLIHTGTRGALVGLGAGTVSMPVALALWGNRRALRAVALAAGGILVAVAFLFALDQTVGLSARSSCIESTSSARLLATRADHDVISERLAVTKVGLRAFMERPLLGWGPENFGEAFVRLADESIHKFGNPYFDLAHNKAVEELVTKGGLGAVTYLAIWVALVWTIARRRRSPPDEVVAYAVLGALVAYFVQNLVLFDTPTGLLQWALLVAWVAGQDVAPRVTGQAPEAGLQKRRPSSPQLYGRVFAMLSSSSTRGTVIAATTAVLVLAISFLNYRPYVAARTFQEASKAQIPLEEQLAMVTTSFRTFPPLASRLRVIALNDLDHNWNTLSPIEKEQAIDFVVREGVRGLEADPGNARLLQLTIELLQKTTPTEEGLEALEPLLERLQRIAPKQVGTHTRLANQALLRGNYSEALRIIEAYEETGPWTERYFRGLKESAQEGLAAGGADRVDTISDESG